MLVQGPNVPVVGVPDTSSISIVVGPASTQASKRASADLLRSEKGATW